MQRDKVDEIILNIYREALHDATLEETDDGVNLLSVSELQKYTLIKVFNFSIILLSFLCHVKIL